MTIQEAINGAYKFKRKAFPFFIYVSSSYEFKFIVNGKIISYHPTADDILATDWEIDE